MSLPEMLQPLAERLGASASVKNVFGEPITAGEKVIIPVATVKFGLGGGSGKRGGSNQEGGGAGGGAKAIPAGVMEITPQGTRFVPVDMNRKLAAAALIGFGLGVLWAKKRG